LTPFTAVAYYPRDEKSLSIAAASIVAKVYRDKLMAKLSDRSKYRKYHWDENKGYGTKTHREAILKHGATKHHRKNSWKLF
jgi:ribonuclease HII